jgi:hypothetical protein
MKNRKKSRRKNLIPMPMKKVSKKINFYPILLASPSI